MEKENKKKWSKVTWHRIGMAAASFLLVLSMVLTGVAYYFEGTLDGFAGGNTVNVSKEAIAKTDEKAYELALQVQRESTVLLRNENATLPLSKDIKQVNVFGWASTEWIGGGSGSGGVTSVEVDFLAALEKYGIIKSNQLPSPEILKEHPAEHRTA